MNRQEYLYELEKALKSSHVPDYGDIIGEYAEHFDLKSADGYSEEETAARLAPPAEIAAQYADINQTGASVRTGRKLLAAAVYTGDIFACGFFLLLYAWVISIGVFSIAAAAAGILTIPGTGFGGSEPISTVLIPKMPFVCSILIGVSLLALAVLSAAGTEYCRLFVTQLLRSYIRWHKNVLIPGGHVLPPLPKYPQIKNKKRRMLRTVTLVSLLVFVAALTAGLISMMIAAGSLEPWHVWGWFM